MKLSERNEGKKMEIKEEKLTPKRLYLLVYACRPVRRMYANGGI